MIIMFQYLTKFCIVLVLASQQNLARKESIGDKISKIVKQLAEESQDKATVKIQAIYEKCGRAGIKKKEEIDRFLDQYEIQNVWQINQNKTKLTMLSVNMR